MQSLRMQQAPYVVTEPAQLLQRLLDQTIHNNPIIRNAVLRIDQPRHAVSWKAASGLADPERNVAMLPDDQFRSASVGKMVCATVAMRLVEQGQIALDDRIGRYLPGELVRGLHVIHAHDYSDTITVRHLLNHTSGLPHYFRDPGFQELMISEPDRLWQPMEVIDYTKQHLQPQFLPGHRWNYNDTGYLLLGLIIEAVTRLPLHQVYRAGLFDPLGMKYTFMLFREEPRPSMVGREPAHVFLGDLDYTEARSLSADWAGGGLITTVDDLTCFIRAFADRKVFRDPATHEAMMAWNDNNVGTAYGLGIWRFVPAAFGEPLVGEVWGHHGSSRSFMYYWPEQDATICGTLNQDLAPAVWHPSFPIARIVRDSMILLASAQPA
jgi:D-alanyl-D-alanine carboxypeptidase